MSSRRKWSASGSRLGGPDPPPGPAARRHDLRLRLHGRGHVRHRRLWRLRDGAGRHAGHRGDPTRRLSAGGDRPRWHQHRRTSRPFLGAVGPDAGEPGLHGCGRRIFESSLGLSVVVLNPAKGAKVPGVNIGGSDDPSKPSTPRIPDGDSIDGNSLLFHLSDPALSTYPNPADDAAAALAVRAVPALSGRIVASIDDSDGDLDEQALIAFSLTSLTPVPEPSSRLVGLSCPRAAGGLARHRRRARVRGFRASSSCSPSSGRIVRRPTSSTSRTSSAPRSTRSMESGAMHPIRLGWPGWPCSAWSTPRGTCSSRTRTTTRSTSSRPRGPTSGSSRR